MAAITYRLKKGKQDPQAKWLSATLPQEVAKVLAGYSEDILNLRCKAVLLSQTNMISIETMSILTDPQSAVDQTKTKINSSATLQEYNFTVELTCYNKNNQKVVVKAA